ncbi:MAG: hypothetical protein WA960_21870 [Tunicatimonas sp.]
MPRPKSARSGAIRRLPLDQVFTSGHSCTKSVSRNAVAMTAGEALPLQWASDGVLPYPAFS